MATALAIRFQEGTGDIVLDRIKNTNVEDLTNTLVKSPTVVDRILTIASKLMTHRAIVQELTISRGLFTGRTKHLIKWFDQEENAEVAFKVLLGSHADKEKWARVKQALSQPRTLLFEHRKWIDWLEEYLGNRGAANVWLDTVSTINKKRQEWMNGELVYRYAEGSNYYKESA